MIFGLLFSFNKVFLWALANSTSRWGCCAHWGTVQELVTVVEDTILSTTLRKDHHHHAFHTLDDSAVVLLAQDVNASCLRCEQVATSGVRKFSAMRGMW